MDHVGRTSNAKRKRAEDEEEDIDLESKKFYRGEVEEEPDLDDLLGDLDEDAIERLVDAAPETERIDSSGVKRLLAAFETAYTENTKMREKFAGEAEKFVASEMQLDKTLRDLQAIATAPEHYIELLKLGSHDSLLSLLSHENSDIVIDVIDVLRDFLANDDDTHVDETQREIVSTSILVLATQLLKLDLLPLVSACIARFDENIAEEKQGVYNALELLENLFEIAIDKSCEIIIEKTQLVKWLLQRLSEEKSFDDVKLYSSEILCILAQSSPEIQERIGTDGGIELLLKTLSKYRKENPSVAEEEEMLENIFNILCVSTTHPTNRKAFMDCEGLDLIKLLIKSKKYAKRGASKLLNFYLTNDLLAATRWLEIGGLGTLFSALLHTKDTDVDGKSKKRQSSKKKSAAKEDEEHIISSLAALLTNFKDAVQQAQQQLPDGEEPKDTVAEAQVEKYSSFIERVVVKFAESNCEKLERLVSMHSKYLDRMRAIDARMQQEDDEDQGRDEEEEDQIYEDRLEAGLFTLQLVDYILVFVSNSLPALKQRATKLLKEKGGSWSDVKLVLMEYAVRAAAENGEDPESSTGETAYIKGLADSIQD